MLKADPRFVRCHEPVDRARPRPTHRALPALRRARPRAEPGARSPARARPTYREGVAWLWATMYLENFWDNRDNPSVRRELLTLVRNVRRVKSLAQCEPPRPLPGVMHVQWRGRVWLAARARGLARRLRN